MIVEQARLFQYRSPLNYPLPLKGSEQWVREGIIVELRSGDCFGYGEAAPLADFSQESLSGAYEQLQQLCGSVESMTGFDRSRYSPSVVFAVESAIWSLQQPRWLAAPVCAPLLQGKTQDILSRLTQWKIPWPAEFKLKIGRGSIDQDINRIHSVLEILPRETRLRLDANQRWTIEEAIRVGRQLPSERIAYIEEPTSNSEQFPLFYQETGVFYALDETVQDRRYTFRPHKGLAALILKPTLVGGVDRCKCLIEAARCAGIRAVFSSSFESSVGIHVLQQLSAQLTPDELPGLDTLSAFQKPLVLNYPQPGQKIDVF